MVFCVEFCLLNFGVSVCDDVGLGCVLIGNFFVFVVDVDVVVMVYVVFVWDVWFFDIVFLYGLGESEWKFGFVFCGVLCDDYVIVMKVGCVFVDVDGWLVLGVVSGYDFVVDFSRDGVWRSFDGSFVWLGVDCVDVFYLYDFLDVEVVFVVVFFVFVELCDEGVVCVISVGFGCFDFLECYVVEVLFDVVMEVG